MAAALMIALVPMITHCVDSRSHYSFVTLGGKYWHPGNTVEFSFPDSVRQGARLAAVWIRFDQSAPPAISLAVTSESSDGEVKADTVAVTLFSSRELPLGRGTYGLYELSMPLATHPMHPYGTAAGDSAVWTFSLAPTAPVPGLHEIGMSIH